MVDLTCYLNGHFLPLSEAKISVLDRGFIFGDAIYEVIPVFGGAAFRLTEHLQRLRASLAAVSITAPLPTHRWTSIIEELIGRHSERDQTIYIQVSRGVAPRDHVLSRAVEPTVFLMSSPLKRPHGVEPITAVTIEDFRWSRCNIKTTSLIANVMSRAHAVSAGAQEAIFIRDGFVTEAATCNVFIAKSGVVKTPPLTSEILPGVTRNLVVELFDGTDPSVREESISQHELMDADEVWVTSSSRELVPVIKIDDEPVGDGLVGPLFQRVRSVYQIYRDSIEIKTG